jgi:hypothetical protein
MTPCERATYDAGIVAVRQMALTTAVMLRIRDDVSDGTSCCFPAPLKT